MDVKPTFLKKILEETFYMEQLEGYVLPRQEEKVCKLNRSIYGLKQASRSWNKRFDEIIKTYGFLQNEDEPCVYQLKENQVVVFLVLYVDGILIIGNNIKKMTDIKEWLDTQLKMKDLGEAAYVLGI